MIDTRCILEVAGLHPSSSDEVPPHRNGCSESRQGLGFHSREQGSAAAVHVRMVDARLVRTFQDRR